MAESGIQFFNRYTGEVETEMVYVEQWLRFILFNPFGKITLHTVAKRAWFSREDVAQHAVRTYTLPVPE